MRGRGVPNRPIGLGDRLRSVHHDVRMSSTPRVVTWEKGAELGNAIGCGLLRAAEPRPLVVGLILKVSISTGNDAAIHTSGVGLCGSLLVVEKGKTA